MNAYKAMKVKQVSNKEKSQGNSQAAYLGIIKHRLKNKAGGPFRGWGRLWEKLD